MIGLATQKPPARPRATMSRYDLEIIVGYARGRTVAAIAQTLDTTEGQVRSRTQRLSKRLGLAGAQQAALVHWAYCNGHLQVVRRRVLRPLPPRPAEVLACAARGLGCRATARAVVWTPRARCRRWRCMRTVSTLMPSSAAVAVAWEAGLLGPGPKEGRTP
ncbi:hypothetical protein KMT30_47930 [Streptomyces sp. IBSBF 2953]|nr:hypothetical protein [Streptomyces hayashii]